MTRPESSCEGMTARTPLLRYSPGGIGDPDFFTRERSRRPVFADTGLGRGAIAIKKLFCHFHKVGTFPNQLAVPSGMWQLDCQFEVRSDGPSTAAAASDGTDSRRRR
jgi:hypothetical protein